MREGNTPFILRESGAKELYWMRYDPHQMNNKAWSAVPSIRTRLTRDRRGHESGQRRGAKTTGGGVSIKSVECPACEGTGHSPIPVRPWVDGDGVERRRYPMCSYCGGERYISKEAALRFRHSKN